MKDKDYEMLAGYLEKLANQKLMINRTMKDPLAPVDAAVGMEAELKRFRDDNRDKILDIVVWELVERETIKRREVDDGR